MELKIEAKIIPFILKEIEVWLGSTHGTFCELKMGQLGLKSWVNVEQSNHRSASMVKLSVR